MDPQLVEVMVTRRFNAPAERVFDAWIDPENAGRWLFATESGLMVRTEIESRVGGRFAIVERREGEDVAHTGEYLELARPQRLAFTLMVEKYSADVDRVNVEIAAHGYGCALTLTHVLAPGAAEDADRTRTGWTAILDALAAVLA